MSDPHTDPPHLSAILNASALSFRPPSTLLHEPFLERAKSTPSSPALVFCSSDSGPPSTLTYAELDARSAALARTLRARLGAQAQGNGQPIVPLALPPSPELYIAYLAVLRAGCPFSPLPQLDAAPAERLRELVAALGARIVLGLGEREEWMAGLEGVQWVDVREGVEDGTALSIDERDWDAPGEDDLAYVMFTSGSTGKPKGVQITHRAAASSIAAHLAVKPLSADARWFQFAASTFDPSLMETFMTLSSGATLCAADRYLLLTDPEKIIRILECTHMMATPSMAAVLRRDALGPNFRELWTMGEKLTDNVIEAFSSGDGEGLMNAYGPTEAAINVTLRPHPLNTPGSNLGAPLPSAAVLILPPAPAAPEPLPFGTEGELAIAGPQLARGYFGQPERTAEAFVDVPGVGRAYRTGDKAKIENGEVMFLGRMEADQVKINGKRVELGEIDAILSRTSSVQSALSLISADTQLVALLVPSPDSATPESDLIVSARDTAARLLPQHMQPLHYFVVPAVPRSAAGKTDRKAAQAIAAARLAEAPAARDASAPDADVPVDEEMLGDVKAAVAETAGVNVGAVADEANLLALGIDSLRGIRLLQRLRERGREGLTIVDVLQNPTPLSLARLLSAPPTHAPSASSVVPSLSVPASLLAHLPSQPTSLYPATPTQSGILTTYLAGSSPQAAYLHTSVHHLAPSVDAARLKAAWAEVRMRHDVLRSAFVALPPEVGKGVAFAGCVLPPGQEEKWVEEKGQILGEMVEQHLERVHERVGIEGRLVVPALLEDKAGKRAFVLTLHHALFDGGSLALILQELSTLFADPAAPISRTPFSHALAHAYSFDASENEAYWSSKLAGHSPDPFPDLSGLRPRAKSGRSEVETIVSQLSWDALAQRAQELRTTPLAAVQAAWAALLYAYSEADSPSVVFGSVISNRSTPELATCVGPTFTTVPARLPSSDGLTNGDVLAHFARDNVDALRHPIPPSSAIKGPDGLVYDTTVALQRFEAGARQSPLWDKVDWPAMTSEFAVMLELWPHPTTSAIDIRATFSTSILTRSATTAMLEQFDDVLSHILHHPSAPYLSAPSHVRPALLSAINPHPALLAVPDGELLHSQFERNAREKPDALAVWFKYQVAGGQDVKWTYKSLNEKANKVARVLRGLCGGLTDQPVPLCLDKSPELYLAVLAVLKAGAAWCPIDPAFPTQRKFDLLTRAAGRVVVVASASDRAELLGSGAVPEGVHVLALDDPRIAAEQGGSDLGDVGTRPEHLAYLIWTSGTTGLPKGVPIEHRAAVQSLKALQDAIPWRTDGVRCLQFSAYTFDVSVQDFFYTWGEPAGTLCSATRDVLLGQFADLCNEVEATHAFLTPAFMATVPLKSCRTFQALTSIGEKLPDAVADAWCAEGVVSINSYGPAESTIVSTARTWTPGEACKAHNVGLPLPTISCFVVKGDEVLPRGAAGELALGGHQNARGYLRQPDKTAAKFVDHPVAGPVYLTGDVVRILHDGTCEFVGRTDDLVKIGGIRIELSEISAAINEPHKLAREAATLQLTRPDRPQTVICTFVAVPSLPRSAEPNTSPLAVEIACAAKDLAHRTLPSYMLPNVFLVLDHIPHTPSNKIDRKALAAAYANVDIAGWERDMAGASGGGAGVEDDGEWTETEIEMRDAVSELTGAPKEAIDRRTHLPALGVDSIRSITLSTKFRLAGIHLAVVDIIQNPTIRQLSELLASRAAQQGDGPDARQRLEAFDGEWRGKVGENGQGVERVLPCTPLQEGMLGETMQDPRAYWTHHLLALRPSVDVQRLRGAWTEVASRTEALRVGFVAAAEVGAQNDKDQFSPTFLQLFYSSASVDWNESATALSLEQAAKDRAGQVVKERAGLRRPPWVLTLFALPDNQRVLMLSMHHSIFDADTLNFILSDVNCAYLDRPIPDRLPLSDALAIILPGDAESPARFWAARLADYADPDAPTVPDLTGRSRSALGSTAFFSKRVSTRTARTALATAAQALDGSLGNLVQAAWAVVLAAYLETSSVVFGETLSARLASPQLATALGPFITATPVPVRLDESKTARQLVAELGKLAQSSIEHRHVPLRRVGQALQRPKGQALFPAMFVLHLEQPELVGEEIWERLEDVVGLQVEHGLALNVELREGGVELDLWGDSGLVAPQQLELLVQQVDAVLSALVEHPDKPLLSLSSAQIPPRLLSISQPTPSNTLRDAPLRPPTYWLEHHAAHNPDFVAAVVASSIEEEGVETRSWTYRELDEASNRVANFILSSGVSNQTVAFCMGRTLEAYAYQLGIFKSGNTYLPIEEDLPTARKDLLVRDSSAALVFTTSTHIESFSDVSGKAQIVCAEQPEHAANLAAQPNSSPQVAYRPEAPSYLLYTSGSTGTPKGVIVSAGNLSGFIEAFIELINRDCPIAPFAGKGRYLGRTSIAFDVHLLELFGAFRMGMAAASAPRTIILDDLGLTLQKLEISHASLVPSLLERAELVPSDVPALRWLSVGGEKISARIVDVWGDDPGGVVLFNAYGPTEVTIGCSLARVQKHSSPRSIGKIFDNCEAYVLKPGKLDIALRGQPGELCVTGDLVAIGYFNRPEARGFVDDFHGKKLYRTGDMVRLMADDTIEYLGRSDDQAKIRGQRLELAEVSECIRASSHESVGVATLVIRHPSLQRDSLVSFVARSSVSANQPSILFAEADFASSLQRACRERLPAFMVPDLVFILDFIPLAATSGKADAKVLRRIFAETPLSDLLGSSSPASSRPLNAAEVKVRDVLLAMINAEEQLRSTTTVFELGIDSLSAISLSFKLRAAGFDAPVPYLLGGPSVEELAKRTSSPTTSRPELQDARRRLEELHGRLRAQLAPAFTPSKIAAVRPALPLQEGLVARSLDSSAPAYVNHVILRLDQTASLGLVGAFEAAIAENEILRTCFAPVGDEIVQVVLHPSSLPSPWSSRELPAGEDTLASIRSSLPDVAADIVQNLARVPPLRLSLWESPQTAYLVISMHHSIYDGESLPMLLNEVERRYLGTYSLQRAPFAALVEHVAAQSPQDAEAFYSQYLANLDLPPALEPVEDGHDYHTHEVTVPSPLVTVESSARSMNVSLHTLAQTAFAIGLAEHMGHGDLIFGVVLSGRTVPVEGADSILAPCITTVPVRARLATASDVQQLAQQLQQDSTSLLAHQHTSLRAIQKWAAATQPLFETLFSFTRAQPLRLSSDIWCEVDSSSAVDHHLAVEVEAHDDTNEIILRATFTPVFGAAPAAALIRRMQGLLSDAGQSLALAVDSASRRPSRSPRAETYDEAVWSSEEEVIRFAVSEVCGVEPAVVTKAVSFLRLGLDSISSIRLAQRLRKSGLKVRSSSVMRHACVGDLARHVAQENAVAPSSSAEPEAIFARTASELYQAHSSTVPLLSPSDVVDAVYPATALQAAMLTSTLASAGQLYLVPHPLRLNPSIDLRRLRDAWDAIVSRTDILRTTFHPDADLPWIAAVHRDAPLQWTEHAGVANEQLSDAVARLVGSAAIREPEGFEKSPLWIHVLVSPDEKLLLPIIHHSLYDGMSLSYILSDVEAAYRDASATPRPPFRSALPHILQRPSGELDFWRRRLSGYSPSSLVVQNPCLSAAPQFCERKSSVLIADIEQACKALEVTVQAAALLAWGKLLASLTGTRDIVFGQVVSGRSIPLDNAYQVAGPLFNTIPFRFVLGDDAATNAQAAQAQQAANVAAEPYHHTPLREVQAAWRGESRNADALFDCLFVFQKTDKMSADEADPLWQPVELDGMVDEPEYPVNVEIEHVGERLALRASCRSGMMDLDALSNLLNRLDEVLSDVIRNPSAPAVDLPPSLRSLPPPLATLASSESSPTVAKNEPVPPADENLSSNEQLLREVLADIARVPIDKIGRHTPLYAIGLDSIAAIQVASRCRRRGLKIAVADVLAGVHVAGICELFEARKGRAKPVKPVQDLLVSADVKQRALAILGVNEDAVEAVLPVLPGQRHHLAAWLKGGRTFYEPPFVYRASAPLDPVRAAAAWRSLRQRHSILRTAFAAVSETDVVQVALKDVPSEDPTWAFVELQGSFEEQVVEQIRLEASRPSDMFFPPVRGRHVRVGGSDAFILFIHHVLYDAWSIPLLISDLGALYDEQPCSSSPHFTDLVQHVYSSRDSDADRQHWSTSLSEARPTLFSPPASSSLPADTFVFIRNAITNISTLCSSALRSNLALPSVILASLGRVFSVVADCPSPIFGLFQTGRSASFDSIERVAAPTLNVLPLRVRAAGAGELKEVAAEVQAELGRRTAHEQVSSREIGEWVGVLGQPLYNVYVNLLWHTEHIRETKGQLLERMDVGVPTDFATKHPVGGKTAVDAIDRSYLPEASLNIDIALNADADAVDIALRCEGRLMDDPSARKLVGDFAEAVQRAVDELV